MKTFATTALTTGVPFGLFMGGFFAVQNGMTEGMASGLACGVLFGLTMAWFATRQAKKFIAMRPQFAAEGLVHDGAASVSSGIGKSGGWLFLTKQRLIFEPHKVNVGAKRIELALTEIAAARAPKGVFASRLEVTAKTGDAYRFIVRERDLWLAMLASAARPSTDESRPAATPF